MELKYDQLNQNIDRGHFSPVYLFVGEEDFLKEEALRRIISALVREGAESFCLDVLSGYETDAATIINFAYELPMLGEKRVVVVRNVDELPESDRQKLVDYVRSPCPSTCLVLIAAKVDRDSDFYKRLRQAATVVTFWPLFDNQVPGWLQQRANRLGKTISREACFLLQDIVGNNLTDLANEIEKLGLYVGERQQIERGDVESAVGLSRVGSVFKLLQAVGERDTARALRISGQMIQAGESPIGVVSMLTKHFSSLVRVRALVRERRSPEEIAATLGLRRMRVPDYVKQSANFSEDELKRGFELLYRADIALKSGVEEPKIVMDFLVSALSSPLEAEAARGLFPVEWVR